MSGATRFGCRECAFKGTYKDVLAHEDAKGIPRSHARRITEEMTIHFQRKTVSAFTATKKGEVSVGRNEHVIVSKYIPAPGCGWILRNNAGKEGFAPGSIFVKTLCSKDTCNRVAKRGEFCNEHADRQLQVCTFKGCTKKTYHGLCGLHATCSFVGCTVIGFLKANGRCRTHTVRTRCIVQGCTTNARSNMRCHKHSTTRTISAKERLETYTNKAGI
jgi:hypothetical protein